MDLDVAHAKVDVPSRGPAHLGLLPLHGVGEVQLRLPIGIDQLRPGAVREIARVPMELELLVTDRHRFHLEANHSVLVLRVHVVGKDELQVVVDIDVIPVHLAQPIAVLVGNFRGIVDADNARGHRQVVHEQVHEVLVLDALRHQSGVLLAPGERPVLLVAQQAAVDLLIHPHLIRRIDDSVAAQHLAQILRLEDKCAILGIAELERVVLIGQLGATAGHLHRLHVDLLVLDELHRRHAGHVETVDHQDEAHQQDHCQPWPSHSPGLQEREVVTSWSRILPCLVIQ